MSDNLERLSESEPVEASAPCRIDMGGTLDISTFYYPLRHLKPCTFNIALNTRTRVRLFPYDSGMVKISSRGFESAAFPLDQAPFDHPMGLMFAIAAYFRADGIHIDIHSSSPPRSALGGSSAAAVALVAAFLKQTTPDPLSRSQLADTAVLAHAIEQSVAGIPCGFQDQLAAVYGGVNAWYWSGDVRRPAFERKIIMEEEKAGDFENHFLVAYCGIPHESKNINGRWVSQFLAGKNRNLWAEIISCTQTFTDALGKGDFKAAVSAMNRETAIRRQMTPDVLDEIGEELVETAIENQCGGRFTGAGGGGCIWAIGESKNIDRLRQVWEKVVAKRQDACLLDVKTDWEGLKVGSEKWEKGSEKWEKGSGKREVRSV
ncbi:MAG: galactokinase [Desulfobacteraceae bacterium 4572_88]|nr:MAG: galactokinase [Desulfobacteraceae bacterium 4572_88]